MKIFLKFISFIIAIILLFTNVSYAQFLDVKTTSSYYNAVDLLVALDIIKGYENNMFLPENTITRAEYAAVICRVLGNENAAKEAKETNFTDVSINHWASGYISFAYSKGIISGMGDGTFQPDSPVTVAQAVKMLMASIGYNDAAKAKGGFPSGYLAVANQEGITKNLVDTSKNKGNIPAMRSVVCAMIYNALDVAIMEQITTGSKTTFEKANKMLIDNLNVAKIDGRVTNTHLSCEDNSLAVNEVVVSIDQRYIIEKGKKSVSTDPPYSLKLTDLTGDASDKLQVACTFYIKGIKDDKPQLLSITQRQAKNSLIKIDRELINDAETDQIKNGKVYYWKDDKKLKDTIINLESEVKIDYYLNNVKQAASYQSIFNAVNGLFDGDITLINVEPADIKNNSAQKYGVVMVNQYKEYIVNDVNASTYCVKGNDKDNSSKSISFDLTNKEDSKIEFLKDGKKAAFSDIHMDDVISICGMYSEVDKLKTGKVYISSKIVEGIVKKIDDSNNTFSVDANNYKALFNINTVNIGESWRFLIDALGKVVGKTNVVPFTKTDFAYITKITRSADTPNQCMGRFLNANGQWATLHFSSILTVNNTITIDSTDAIAPSSYSNTTKDVQSNNKDLILKFDKSIAPSWAGKKDARTVNAYMLVTYSLNSKGEVDKICFDFSKTSKGIYGYQANVKGVYTSEMEKLTNYFLVSNTTIFNISSSDLYSATEGQISVSETNMLTDQFTYTGAVLYETKTKNAVAMSLQNLTEGMRYNAPFMIVSNVSNVVNDDGDHNIKLEGFESGQAKTISYLRSNAAVENVYNATISAELKRGDVISYYTYKVKDVISRKTVEIIKIKITLLFRPETQIVNDSVINQINTANNGLNDFGVKVFQPYDDPEHTKFVYGLVRSEKDTRINLVMDDTAAKSDNDYSTARVSNVYSYDGLNTSPPMVKLADMSDIQADKVADSTAASDEGDFIFARADDGEFLRDIVIIKRKNNFKDK